MTITVTLNSPEELLRFFETMDPTKDAASKQQYEKPEVLPEPPAATPAPAPATKPAEAPAASKQQKAVTYDDVSKKAIALMDAGRRDDLRNLLAKHGAQALPELKNKPDVLAAFAADLEVM